VKRCRVCADEKPLSEFYLRKDTGRYRTECKACTNVSAGKWAAENPDKRRAVSLKWAKANYPYLRAKKAEYRAADPLRMRRWSLENPERMQALRDKWNAENRDRKAAHRAARRARLAQALPAWADRWMIAEAYHLARLRTRLFGFPWEVDHIVPLAGKTVCGLHVESNLRVVPLTINRAKGHHRWPDMP
jgi:hypothetical protein